MVSSRICLLTLILATTACAAAPARAPASATESASAAAAESATATASASESASASAPAASAAERYSRAKAARAKRGAIDVQVYVLDQALRDVDAERAARLSEKRHDLLKESERALAEEIAELSQITDKQIPADVDAPSVLLALARALDDAGRAEEATARYELLVARYPTSPLAAQAHLGLAARAFAEERLEDVITHCDAVLASEGGEGRVEALYLESWALRGLADEGKVDAGSKAEEMLASVTKMEPRSAREEQIIEAAKREMGGVRKGRGKISL